MSGVRSLNFFQHYKENNFLVIRCIFVISLMILHMGSSPLKTMNTDPHDMLKRKQILKKMPCDENTLFLRCVFVFSGVLDRFENNIAIILIEEIGEELIIAKDQLPENSSENTWFKIEKHAGTYKVIAIDSDKTDQEAKKSLQLIKTLRQKHSH